MSALKTLIVGFGGIARGLSADKKMAHWFPIATHAQALMAGNGFEWVGVVDADVDARASAVNDWHMEAYETPMQAAHLEPDVLVLATPPGGRADALAQLPSVKAIFTEKPLGNMDGDGLIAAATAQCIPLQVNYWRRGDETLGELARGGLKKRIGTLQAGHAVYGNGLNNNGSHLIDMIRMLLGEPDWVQAIGDVTPHPHGPVPDDIQTAFALGYAHGAVITAHPLNFEHYREVGLDLWGTAGRLTFQQETLDIRHLPLKENRGLDDAFEIAADQGEALTCTVADALPRLYRNLHDAVTENAELLSPGSSAIITERLIAMIRRSADNGHEKLTVPGGR